MPVEILTAAQRAEWERFPAEIDELSLARCFTFPDDELERIVERKGVHLRFALAATVGALRWLGFVPATLPDLPERAAALIAEQLDVQLAQLAGRRFDELQLGRLSPAIYEHILINGRYLIDPDRVANGRSRPPASIAMPTYH